MPLWTSRLPETVNDPVIPADPENCPFHEPVSIPVNCEPSPTKWPLELISPCTSNFWCEKVFDSEIVSFGMLNLLNIRLSFVWVPTTPPTVSLAKISISVAPPSLENLPSLAYKSPLALISPVLST